MTTGPIFISHSSVDKDDINDLARTIREAFNDDVRIFNTSSGWAIPIGVMWRERLLAALGEASLVILWATQSALGSDEVAFEIGAATALGKKVLPCCVHVSPSVLRWGLSEKQAVSMDEPDGWDKLTNAIAAALNYSGPIDQFAFRKVASQYQPPSNPIVVEALGLTVEIRNNSAAPVYKVTLVDQSTEPDLATPWLQNVDEIALDPGETKLIFRDDDPNDRHLQLSWIDVAGLEHSEDIRLVKTRDSAK